MACGCNARHKRESLTAWQKPTHKHIANTARDRKQQLRHSLAWLNGKPQQRTFTMLGLMCGWNAGRATPPWKLLRFNQRWPCDRRSTRPTRERLTSSNFKMSLQRRHHAACLEISQGSVGAHYAERWMEWPRTAPTTYDGIGTLSPEAFFCHTIWGT